VRRGAATAAAVVLCLALLGACSDDDADDGAADTTTTTATTTTTTTAASGGEDSTTTTARGAEEPGGDRPTFAVAALEDGRFGIVDLAAGDVREIGDRRFSDLTQPPAEGGAYFVADLALTPDRSTVWVDTCCEPAAGSIVRIDLTTGRQDDATITGWSPSVSPDGEAMAHGHYSIGIGIVRGGESVQVDGPPDDGTFRQYEDTVWLDDSSIAYVLNVFDGPQPRATVYVHDIAASDLLGDRVLFEPGEPVVAMARRGDGALVWVGESGAAHVVDPASGDETATFDLGEPVVDIAYDATGTWLLVVDEDRDLRWLGGGEEGTVPGRYVAAAW
jgi:hypothetical protein